MTTVTDTVPRLLRWAASEPDTGAPLPGRTAGPPSPEQDPALLVERLAAVTAARMRLSDPPLGDPGPAGLPTLLLAAAVALREGSLAERTLDSVSAPGSARDLLARHGLVHPVLTAGSRSVGTSLGTALLRHSPLTGLLDAPAPGDDEPCRQLLDRLLDHPEGRRTVTAALSAPPRTPDAMLWRSGLLSRYRFDPAERQWVYDVYETALLHHGPYYTRRTREAVAVLTGETSGAPDTDRAAAAWADATSDWWRPLDVLVRRFPAELRARRMLRGHEGGLRLSRLRARAESLRELRAVTAR
ncbi:hypothetical protein [Streptomyces sp. NPDC059575]|uniref:hypothetical protein n=1 Tax=Streptomyces sp. NPDC059575 TaxID=3346872 RepID=UPI00369013E3